MRWQGIFLSPNQAALVMALVGIGLCGIISATATRNRLTGTIWTKSAFGLATLLLVGSLVCLAATQSRAGCLAFAVSVVVCILWGSLSVRTGGFALLLLALSVALWPGTVGRASTALSDAVYGERPTLSCAALAMIHDYFWLGCGERFEELYNHWYLPDSLEGRYKTALTDFLTAAATFGAPVAVFLASIVAFLVVISWSLRSNKVCGILVGMISVHLICGLFQAHLFSLIPLITFTATVITLAILCGRKTASVQKRLLRNCVSFSIFIVFGLALIYITSWILPRKERWTTRIADGSIVAKTLGRHPVMRIGVFCDSQDERVLRRGIVSLAIDQNFEVFLYNGLSAAEIENAIHPVDSLISARIGVHESASKLLYASLRNGLSAPLALINPNGFDLSFTEPKTEFRSQQNILVVLRKNAPFLPSKESLSEAFTYVPNAMVVSVERRPSDEQRRYWDIVEQYFKKTAQFDEMP